MIQQLVIDHAQYDDQELMIKYKEPMSDSEMSNSIQKSSNRNLSEPDELQSKDDQQDLMDILTGGSGGLKQSRKSIRIVEAKS